jgi:pyruvate,water dikinase
MDMIGLGNNAHMFVRVRLRVSSSLAVVDGAAPLTVSLAEIDRGAVALVGGKGANLGDLARAGFPVPDGFVLTTRAYALAAEAARVNPTRPADAAERLRSSPVPDAIVNAARTAYATLGSGHVAVRSSATAEDLPGASFAGQQDTYLDISGEDRLLDAIRRCWASLWNERAVAYRHANRVDDAAVGLAVVVQKMVDAAAAGVLFTADPVTGRRRRAAIDAVAGLGEKLVAGAVDPDHYVVDIPSHEVVQRPPAGKSSVLSDPEILTLAEFGDRIEGHFDAPQDIEFALDQERHVWIVQSRPITTLYPLPADAPDPERELRVYFSGNVFQGYFEPITPMGIQFFSLLSGAISRMFGFPIEDPAAGSPILKEAGMRLYIDMTQVVRDPVGRHAFVALTSMGEARSSAVLVQLASDPRLPLTRRSRFHSVRAIAGAMMRAGVPFAALRVIRSPGKTPGRYVREIEEFAHVELPADATTEQHLDAFERLIVTASPRMFPRMIGTILPAMLSFALAARLLRGKARMDELQTITRGAPHNPTTEMDLALWALCADVREDSDSRDELLGRTPAELAARYRKGTLPTRLQSGLKSFLERYGFRSIGEIDVGVERWSENPEHILGALANYLRLGDEALAPDALFAKGKREADAMIAALLARVHGPRRAILRVVLGRVRALIGMREAPKFHIIRLLVAPSRELLKPVGRDLVARGLIAGEGDIFFLTLPEARRAARGEDMRELVAGRRDTFDREHARRHIPRLLLSDGTDAEAALVSAGEGLRGSPASPGVISGTARVILSPAGARLEPGEILIAPSTDPGWTPLFLTAGALVMEMGGMMSHGAVVAREYGIPAVVGVAGATDQITTGQRVTVDGSAGTVVLEGEPKVEAQAVPSGKGPTPA